MGPLISTWFHQAQVQALSSPHQNGFLLHTLKYDTGYLENCQGNCVSHGFLPIFLDNLPQTEPQKASCPFHQEQDPRPTRPGTRWGGISPLKAPGSLQPSVVCLQNFSTWFLQTH